MDDYVFVIIRLVELKKLLDMFGIKIFSIINLCIKVVNWFFLGIDVFCVVVGFGVELVKF